MSGESSVKLTMQTKAGSSIEARIKAMDRKLRKCSQQIILLTNALDQLQCKFELAGQQDNAVFLYNLHLRMSTVEGVRQMMYSYASKLGQELDTLHRVVMAVEGDHLYEDSEEEYSDTEYSLDEDQLD